MTVLAVVLLWLAAGYRLHVLRKAPGFINASYAAAATGIAAAFAVKATEAPVDAATGPYVSDLLEHLLVVAGGLGAQLFLLALRTGRPARRAVVVRAAAASAVAAAMVATFAIAPVHHASPDDLDVAYGSLRLVAAYRLVFNLHLTYVLVDNVRLCRRYAAIPGDAGRSVSLTLVGWGSAVALAYSTSRITYTAVDLTRGHAPTVLRTIGSDAATLGLIALAVGMLAPRIVPGLRSWLDARGGLRRLAPLWTDLTAAFPGIVLPTGTGLGRRSTELRYDRHLLETAEGLAKVHLPAGVALVTEQPDALHVLARELHRHRESWNAPAGVRAGDLLPVAHEPGHEHRQLLALADAYAAARARTSRLPDLTPRASAGASA